MLSMFKSKVSKHVSMSVTMLPPSCFVRDIRSLDIANSTSEVSASAAQRVVSCEYLLIPSISLVDGGAASGGRSSSLSSASSD